MENFIFCAVSTMGREIEYNKKAVLQEKLSGKFDATWHYHGCPEFFRTGGYDSLYAYIFFNGKYGFLSMPSICFHEAQIPWTHIFCQFPGNFLDYNNILITMKKDVLKTLAHFSKYCRSYFQITCDSCLTCFFNWDSLHARLSSH